MGRPVSKTELEYLYLERKISARKIGAEFGWTDATILKRLKACSIPRRNRGPEPIHISRDALEGLYLHQTLSLSEIAARYNCSGETIRCKLKDNGIERRPRHVPHPKGDYAGTLQTQAYMIGLRLGDWHVYKPSDTSQIIVVRCHSTLSEQLSLFQELFEPYGHIWQSRPDCQNAINAYAYLNSSFDFLLPKADKVELWIRRDNYSAAAFIAGYVDAEGTFGIYEGRARFKIDSQDRNILKWMHTWLRTNNIDCPPLNRIAWAGEKTNRKGNRLHRDVYRINVNRADSLHKFIEMIQPYVKHPKRRKDMLIALDNVTQRCGIG